MSNITNNLTDEVKKLALETYHEQCVLRKKGRTLLSDIDFMDMSEIRACCQTFKNKLLVELTTAELVELVKAAKFLYTTGERLNNG